MLTTMTDFRLDLKETENIESEHKSYKYGFYYIISGNENAFSMSSINIMEDAERVGVSFTRNS